MKHWINGLGGPLAGFGGGAFTYGCFGDMDWSVIGCMAAVGFALGAWVGPGPYAWFRGELG